jgi:Zn-dependent peptidase ImmA (M78 family)
MGVRWTKVTTEADRLLFEHQITCPPVPVDRIAKKLGAKIVQQAYDGQEICGFLFRDRQRTIIGVNAGDHVHRQRFTIAHELGHLILHELGTDIAHVDKTFTLRLRSEISSQGKNVEEIEANTFASELLMPRAFLLSDLTRLGGFDFEDEQALKALADAYKVSSQAMSFRIARLGFV